MWLLLHYRDAIEELIRRWVDRYFYLLLDWISLRKSKQAICSHDSCNSRSLWRSERLLRHLYIGARILQMTETTTKVTNHYGRKWSAQGPLDNE